MVQQIIGAIILTVIGLSLFSVVLDFTATAQADPNITTSQSTLVGLVPTFFIIGLVVSVIAIMLGPMLLRTGKGRSGGLGF